MLHFDQFGTNEVPILPDTEIGRGVRLVFDPAAHMELSVRRSARVMAGGRELPTLVLRGTNRAPDDWLGVEVDLPHPSHDIELTARNYPVHRLFPRLHFDHAGGTGHVDLPDVAAHDSFATRLFSSRNWLDAHGIATASAPRLTILIPSSPWFAMELQSVMLQEVANA